MDEDATAPEPDWEVAAGRLAAESIAGGDPTGWFDRLYAAADAGEIGTPWSRTQPHPLLADWAERRRHDTGTAVVVGCGLGADAEFLARLGYETTAFDVSPTAVDTARRRHPGSPVRYTTADLLDLPEPWPRAYRLVVEVFTVQALPPSVRPAAMRNVGRLVAPGGTLVAIEFRADAVTVDDPPPWPLGAAELDAFGTDGLRPVSVEALDRCWRAEFRRAP